MTKARRIFALVLTLCLMLPLCMTAGAEGTGVVAGAFKKGAYASEGDNTVYFTVANAGKTGLYSVPSVGGSIELLESEDSISDLIAVGDKVYYLRSVSGSWQLVCRTATELSILNVFSSGANVGTLGYYDGVLYAVCNNWLYSFSTIDGTQALVAEQLLSDYFILGGRIYFISVSDQRTYQRVDSESNTVSVAAGCLYSMALDGSDTKIALEVGVSDLRGYGEYLYFHNYSDNYFMASSTEKWLEGRLYRYNIITETNEKAHEDYDWDFYPTSNGLLLYTLESIDMRNVTENSSVNLMKPEQYTSVAVDDDSVLVYEHTSQTMTRVPTNGEISTVLGSVLPDSAVAAVMEIDQTGEAIATVAPAATANPEATKKPAATKKPSGSSATSSSYIFPESSTRKLTKADLKAVDPTLWAFGRNEIWARHGYEFSKKVYADYFATKTWYKPGGYSSSSLSSIEWYNMEFIKKYEKMYADEIAALKAGATPKPGKTTAPTKAPSDSTYLIPDSSTRKLTRSDILAIDRELWGYARNEIYARHGYEFNTAKYAKYFANKTWYKAGGFSTKDLSDIEWYNMDLIKQMESEY